MEASSQVVEVVEEASKTDTESTQGLRALREELAVQEALKEK